MKTLARMFTLIISFQMMIGCDSIALQNALQDVSMSETIEISGSISSVFKKVSNIIMPSAIAEVSAPLVSRTITSLPTRVSVTPKAVTSDSGCCIMCRCMAPVITVETGTIKVFDINDIDNPIEIYSEATIEKDYKITLQRSQVEGVDLKLVYLSDSDDSSSREVVLDDISKSELLNVDMDVDKTLKARLISDVRSKYKSLYSNTLSSLKTELDTSSLDLSSLGDSDAIKQLVLSRNAEAIRVLSDYMVTKMDDFHDISEYQLRMAKLLNPTGVSIGVVSDFQSVKSPTISVRK